MYEYIKGIYKGINKDYIVIENNGIGYRVYSSGSTMAELPNINEDITLYTIQIVRQDFIGLYGFSTVEELELFEKLLTVNGVGAKAALSLLSISNVGKLTKAIVNGEDKVIVKAPGIGKKIAQRVILELKDKLQIVSMSDDSGEEILNSTDCTNDKIERDSAEALKSLGYSDKEISKALEQIENRDSIEQIIKESLKYLMN